VRETLAVFRKEARSLFVGPIPYLVAVVFSVFLTWQVYDQAMFLILRQASLETMFNVMPLAASIAAPAIAMRAWSEELRSETLEVLMTSPLRARHAVIGKFLAGLLVLALCILSTIAIPITAMSLGDMDTGPLVAGYVGALLLGGACLSVGLWLSALTRNQIVALLLGLVVCFSFSKVDALALSGATGAFGEVLTQLSMSAHFKAIARGVFDLRDLVYFACVIGFFLYLNVEAVENRRYA